MRVGFIGNYQSGYVGEISDESHLAREIESLGHEIYRIPRDEWREYVIEGFPQNKYKNVPEIDQLDIIIFAKWNGFYDGSFIIKAREKYKCPCFLWVWDFMQGEAWHMEMARAADLYLGNDVYSGFYKNFTNAYYFPFDVSDKNYDRLPIIEKLYDVSFFGSWIPQGNRQEWLKEINKVYPITVFTWNPKGWPEEFKGVRMPVYGDDFAYRVAQSKICLGFSVDPHTWGYWSNRVGKILTVGGFLLYQYAPGMELFLRDGVAYFSSPQEAVEKIRYYLFNDEKRQDIADIGYEIGRTRFTSKGRIEDLMILADRFIKKGNSVWSL